MPDSEREERIRSLVDSLSADDAERDRLKRQTDETLALLHRAVRELIASRRPTPASFGREGLSR
jgi:hypothetical protein